MKSDSSSRYLGEYLVQTGIITQEQLKNALNKQSLHGDKRTFLGQILVELGYATEEAVARAVALQARVPFISLEKYPVDEAAARLLEGEIIQRYQALPIGFEDDRLIVAMAQPRNIIAIDDLRILSGFEIRPVIVADSELKVNIDRYTKLTLEIENARDEEPEQEVLPSVDGSERPAVKLANLIFSRAVRAAASDVHIEPQEKSFRIRFRIDGVLHEVMRPPRRLHPSLVSRIKVLANMDIAERRIPQDGRITLRVEEKTIDVRVASLPTAYGEKLTLRILDRDARLFTLKDLGFPERELNSFNQVVNLPYGMILVTGPTGSGKSTTLYAVLNALNVIDKHIVTLEDPIERRLDGINQVQVNIQAGLIFASGLRSILRNDPDIVMVGEIRDHETARISVESSLTGHLVLSTLHTNDAAGAITRLHDMGIEPYLTASCLICVVAQRLVRTLCPHCKEPYELSREELLKMVPDFPIGPGEETVRLYRRNSCVQCSDTGYRGRIGVFELLTVSENIAKMALERRSTNQIKETAIAEGMVTLRQNGLLQVKNGLTSLEEVLRVII